MRLSFFIQQLYSRTVVAGIVLLNTGIGLKEWSDVMHDGNKGEIYMLVGANMLLWSSAVF